LFGEICFLKVSKKPKTKTAKMLTTRVRKGYIKSKNAIFCPLLLRFFLPFFQHWESTRPAAWISRDQNSQPGK